MAILLADKCLHPNTKYFNEMNEPDKELIQLAYTAHLCELLKP